ncbi:MAG: glycosyl hydrolase family 8 [Flavobacterium sp.]
MTLCLRFLNSGKTSTLRKDNCADSYFVWSQNAGKDYKCVSEGQGYRMIIVALMSGFGYGKQALFYGLFKYYKTHPSKRNDYHLMSWTQNNGCRKFEESSASDIDIAYALQSILSLYETSNVLYIGPHSFF